MAIVTVAQARSHCRLDSDYPDEQLLPYIDGAEAAAQDYLNRAVFADVSELEAARTAAPQAIADASAAYAAALVEAGDFADTLARQAAVNVAKQRLADAQLGATRVTFGMVATPSVVAAILLTIGRLFESRSDIIVGAQGFELSEGAKALLRPFRRVMMP